MATRLGPVPKALLALLLAVVATGAVVAVVLLDRSPESSPAPPAYEATPLADYDTTGVVVTRGSFCDAVPDAAVEEALGGAPESTTAYDNGDRVRLADGLRDVAHEFGCGWMAPGVTARAWVFAPPVTRRAARDLARSVRDQPDCVRTPGTPEFGRPSTALVCEIGRRTEASYRGLYGDAWLTCTLSTEERLPPDELADRAGRWCVAVVEAARAS